MLIKQNLNNDLSQQLVQLASVAVAPWVYCKKGVLKIS